MHKPSLAWYGAIVLLAASPYVFQGLQGRDLAAIHDALLGAPAAPVLVEPADQAKGVRVNATFRWRSSTGAASYTLQISTDSALVAVHFEKSGLADTTCLVRGLLHGTIYYWRVSAGNNDGTGPFSTTRSFRSRLTPGVNGWGEITASTASTALQHAAGLTLLSGDAYEIVDVTGDSTVSAYDAALILQAAAGLLSVFPVDL